MAIKFENALIEEFKKSKIKIIPNTEEMLIKYLIQCPMRPENYMHLTVSRKMRGKKKTVLKRFLLISKKGNLCFPKSVTFLRRLVFHFHFHITSSEIFMKINGNFELSRVPSQGILLSLLYLTLSQNGSGEIIK